MPHSDRCRRESAVQMVGSAALVNAASEARAVERNSELIIGNDENEEKVRSIQKRERGREDVVGAKRGICSSWAGLSVYK